MHNALCDVPFSVVWFLWTSLYTTVVQLLFCFGYATSGVIVYTAQLEMLRDNCSIFVWGSVTVQCFCFSTTWSLTVQFITVNAHSDWLCVDDFSPAVLSFYLTTDYAECLAFCIELAYKNLHFQQWKATWKFLGMESPTRVSTRGPLRTTDLRFGCAFTTAGIIPKWLGDRFHYLSCCCLL